MSNNENYRIYYRPLKQWFEVSKEEKQNWESYIGTIRKTNQRAGTCCIPYKKCYKCDGICETCEYRCIAPNAPELLSIDYETERSFENGVGNDCFLDDDALTTEINVDHMILHRLLAELKSTDFESYQIMMLIAEGLSERESAARMNMPRNTFVYKRDRLLKALREHF